MPDWLVINEIIGLAHLHLKILLNSLSVTSALLLNFVPIVNFKKNGNTSEISPIVECLPVSIDE